MQVTLNPNINHQTFNGKKCILRRNTSREAVSRTNYIKYLKAEKEWIKSGEAAPGLEEFEYNLKDIKAAAKCTGKFAKMVYYKTMSIIPLLGW